MRRVFIQRIISTWNDEKGIAYCVEAESDKRFSKREMIGRRLDTALQLARKRLQSIHGIRKIYSDLLEGNRVQRNQLYRESVDARLWANWGDC